MRGEKTERSRKSGRNKKKKNAPIQEERRRNGNVRGWWGGRAGGKPETRLEAEGEIDQIENQIRTEIASARQRRTYRSRFRNKRDINTTTKI